MWDVEDRSCGQGASIRCSVMQVFYVDGEKASTAMLEAVLHHLGAKVTHFDDGKDCLASLRTAECHLLISNVRHPALEGLALLRNAKRLVPSVPVVMLVDHGDIRTAVRVMKGGAIDCLERPPEKKHLLSVMDAVLQAPVQNDRPRDVSLSKTEEQVLQLILQGNTTAEVARALRRSRRTIEVHRSHIMRKLEVGSIVDLVRTSARMGLLEDWP